MLLAETCCEITPPKFSHQKNKQKTNKKYKNVLIY